MPSFLRRAGYSLRRGEREAIGYPPIPVAVMPCGDKGYAGTRHGRGLICGQMFPWETLAERLAQEGGQGHWK